MPPTFSPMTRKEIFDMSWIKLKACCKTSSIKVAGTKDKTREELCILHSLRGEEGEEEDIEVDVGEEAAGKEPEEGGEEEDPLVVTTLSSTTPSATKTRLPPRRMQTTSPTT